MIEYINTNILVLLVILVIMMSFNRSKKYLLEMFKNVKDFLIKELQLFLKSIIDYLAKIELILSRKNSLTNDLSLEDLTANLIDEKNSDQLETYLDALQFAVSNKNVINIALTGGFGTGKSTIINEFCKKNRGNEYLHISLANFKDEKSDEKLIETSIVQQILYYEKKLKIKESSYKRIHFTKPLYKLGSIFLLGIWFYSLIFLFFENINSKIIFFKEENTNILSIRFVFILGIICILYKSFDKIKNIKFSKLTPNSLELVNEKTDKELSVFNRNIDEIIYFFEKTNTNVVIVEDIDRFSDDIAIKLYSKIRELSILIKQSKDVNQPVKFIYSVKDELILEDKTKFFDIIIPVIPITDYSNSKNMFFLKLKSFFEKEEVENTVERESQSYLDKNFISEVSNYVYDMRTVINICNEFKLYDKILKTDKPNIDKNKLFAIIFYKNIFPDDFAKIQKQNSKLHNVFKKDFKNDDILKKIIKEIDDKVAEKKEEKNKLKEVLDKQIIKDINELRNVYVFNIIGMIYDKHSVKIREIEKLNISYDLTTDENFLKLKNSDNIKFSYEFHPDTNSGISFKQVENKINNISYNEREKYIIDFHNNEISRLEKEIIGLSNKTQNFKNLSLFELYQNCEEEIEQFLDLIYTIKIKEKINDIEIIVDELNPNINLFKYLIKNDYLNEDFIEYVSYFHLGSLSSNDHKLMMKINQNEFTSFDEKIDDVENLVKNIRDIRFKNRSILIYSILEFLLKDTQNNNLKNEKLNFVIGQIQNYNDKSTSFIEGFIKKIINDNEVLSNFYTEITKWDNFWHLVEVNFSDYLKRKILFDLIQMFSDDDGDRTLVKLNKRKKITNYINSDENFLKDIFDKISINSFIKTLKILEVQFNLITPDKKIKGLLLKVYEEDLYKVNIDNFKLFSQIDGKYHYNEDEFSASNFGFLRSNEDSRLYKRICENLNGYIENVYLKIDQNIKENVKNISFLVSQKDEIINLKNKLEIVKKGFVGKLENFDGILSKEIQAQLLEKNKVLVSWEVILEYYSWESSFDSILNNYLNDSNNYSSLFVTELSNKVDILFGEGENDSCTDFIYELINNENLSQESFEVIFADSGDLVLSSNKINIDLRIPFLEEKDFFVLDQEEIDSLIKNNKGVLVKLIEKSENSFISAIGTYNFEIEFVEDLLNSKLSIESLIAIIIYRENEIIENENLEFLQKIATFYIENKSLSFTSEMFENLISSDLDEKYKIGLFNLVASDENNEYEISDLLAKMGDKFVDIVNEEGISLDINEQNKIFLDILKENNIIVDFKKNSKIKSFVISYV